MYEFKERPTVGRVVHYRSRGSADGVFASKCRAAIVTETHPDSDTISICVLNPTGMFFDAGIEYSNKEIPGTWHWPERV